MDQYERRAKQLEEEQEARFFEWSPKDRESFLDDEFEANIQHWIKRYRRVSPTYRAKHRK